MNNINSGWLKNIDIAHRGLHDIKQGIPENSIPAFNEAIKKKIAIELDVHILRDNTIVVFHDNNLNRCCKINKNIHLFSYNELKTIPLFNTKYNMPLLKDVLGLVNGSVPLIIEVKTDMPAKKTCPELSKIMATYNGLYAIKSFNPLVCAWFKRNNPAITRGILVSDFKTNKKISWIKKIICKNMLLNPICKPHFISADKNILNTSKIIQLRNKNLPVIGWTFKSMDEKEKYISFCDSYIGENYL